MRTLRERLKAHGALGVAIAVLVVGMTIWALGAWDAETAGSASTEIVLVRPDSPSQGPVDAKVTVVEFFDPECEACRAMYPVVKRLQQEYQGRMRLVIRYMPLHRNSVYAASALEAAGEQGRYWEMLEILLANQRIWGNHRTPRSDLIPTYAARIGLDMDAFDRSISAERHKAKVERDKVDGLRAGVGATPTFFINGKQLERNNYESLKTMINEALAQ